MQTLVARQPIFDRSLRVFGYELLFRSGTANAFDGSDGDLATAKVINALYAPDAANLTGTKRVFINFPYRLLLEGIPFALPPETTVVEVLETVEPDAAIFEVCTKLRKLGYRIALDDFVDTQAPHPLVPVANVIKVDLRATSLDVQKKIVSRYGGRVQLLAEKVETQEEFQQALEMGFQYFQGYFFARPVVMASREIPGLRPNYLRILQEVHTPEPDFRVLAALIGREPGLCYKLLRFVNSPLFARPGQVDSIERAITMLGEAEIRRWIAVFVLLDLSAHRPAELVVSTLVRARFCELLASRVGLGERCGDLFLVGVLSRLDALLGRPLEGLLQELNLKQDIRATVLDEDPGERRLAAIWRFVRLYEVADWDELWSLAAELNLSPEAAPDIYAAAVGWADEVCPA